MHVQLYRINDSNVVLNIYMYVHRNITTFTCSFNLVIDIKIKRGKNNFNSWLFY